MAEITLANLYHYGRCHTGDAQGARDCKATSGGVSTRQISIRVGVAVSTERLTLRRVIAAGMAVGIPADKTHAALETVLFTSAGKKTGHRRCADPDWAAIHQELKRKHVTLMIVWDEYIAREPTGYRYSRFCELYRSWEARLSVTMRQVHRAGEKLFVDCAGDTVPVIIDRLTGQTRGAQIFVAVLGVEFPLRRGEFDAGARGLD